MVPDIPAHRRVRVAAAGFGRRATGLVAVSLGGVLTLLSFCLPGAVLPATAEPGVWDGFAAAGEHTLVVLPVYWTTPDAQTTSSLRALARQVGDYWSEQTNGAISVPDARITVHDWMPIASPTGCEKDAIFQAALAAANERAGSYHKHVIVYFPQTPSCAWQGSGSAYPEYEGNIYHSVYGWIWINGYTSADVWQREFGRNLGLGPARGAICNDVGVQVPLSDDCDTRDQFDHDLMGAARGRGGYTLNTALADRIGLLAPDAVRTASVGASFTLSPISTHTGLLAVKVPLPDDSVLYVEYRPSVGRDSAQPAGWSGVQVRQRGRWDYFSRVLALTPDGSDGLHANAAARLGAAWRIPGTYMQLVVDSQDATGARIRFAPLPDITPPPAPGESTVLGTATASGDAQRDGIIGGQIWVGWPALDDPDSGLASFTIHVDGEELRTVPGTATGALLPELAGGVHRVRVDATNNAGMTITGPERFFTTAPAPALPEAPSVTAATHGWQLGGDLTLDWPALDDPDLTRYQVYVDEELLVEVGTGTTEVVVGALSTGDHSARVVAVNTIGLGTSSAPTTFRVDASPPPAPSKPDVTPAARYQGILRGDLQVSWPAVFDPDSGIDAYRVLVDGSVVSSTAVAGHPVPVGLLPSGVHQVRVDAVNGAGLVAAGATATIRVDNTAPVLSAPGIALRPGAASASAPVVITVPAADAGSGICARTTRVNGRVVGPLAQVRTTIPVGRTTSVQVTVTDCVGNVSTATRTVSVTAAPETAGRYSAGWVVRRSGAYTGGTARSSRRRGATTAFTFIGSHVAWTGSRHPTTGVARVYLDGKRIATVDTRGRTANRRLIWATTTRHGRHTLKVVVNGTPGRPAVTLDSFITVRTR